MKKSISLLLCLCLCVCGAFWLTGCSSPTPAHMSQAGVRLQLNELSQKAKKIPVFYQGETYDTKVTDTLTDLLMPESWTGRDAPPAELGEATVRLSLTPELELSLFEQPDWACVQSGSRTVWYEVSASGATSYMAAAPWAAEHLEAYMRQYSTYTPSATSPAGLQLQLTALADKGAHIPVLYQGETYDTKVTDKLTTLLYPESYRVRESPPIADEPPVRLTLAPDMELSLFENPPMARVQHAGETVWYTVFPGAVQQHADAPWAVAHLASYMAENSAYTPTEGKE